MAYADVESLKEHIDDANLSQMAKQAALVMGESDGKMVLSLTVDAYDVTVSIHFAISVDKFFELIDPALKEIDIDLP